MNDLSKRDIEEIRKGIDKTIAALDLAERRDKLSKLQAESLDENFWNNNRHAQDVMSQISYIQEEINESLALRQDIYSLCDIFNSIEKETDQNQLIEEYENLKERLDKLSLRLFLSNPYDDKPAIMTIYAGQGGTEANDWTQMLYRMYTMYFDKQNWKYSVTEMLKGNEAGLVEVVLEIDAPYAFGLLKKEHGTHRLIRISPFNAQGLRQTTFAGVEVLPVLEDINDKDLEIQEKDIEFKAVRAGGPGGQNVNKTSSAVQILHIPTGIMVSSSTQRSQAQNRENAMNLLKAKLWRIKEQEHLQKISDIKGDYKQASWGNQIRNYVLHPYKMVKDLRTGVEISDAESVLDGNLDKLIEAEIRMK
ncbi:peptide chain release factor 2 [bacterium]|nr:peptide chain release factor 2 [bacterium]